MEKKSKQVIKIRKRNGRLVVFDKQKIINVIYKAGRATGEFGKNEAEKLANSVVRALNKKYDGFKIPKVEEIQDVVEETLMRKNWYQTLRAYILYRSRHAKLRRVKLLLSETTKLIKDYIQQADWRVKENANMAYSLQGLNNHIASSVIARYWLQEIYPPKPAQAHIDGDFHIHDLSFLGSYCVGWDLYDLLLEGFKGVPGKIQSRPAKHFRVALGQVANFLYTMQGESAGANALSNFDTLLAPFIAYDELNYKGVKQAMQEFLYNMNVPTRVGFQSPFTNLTFDLTVPSDFASQPVIIAGKPQKRKYAEFQKEMDMLNKAFAEVMLEGDARGRVFTFPIPTYNLTRDFNWENPTLDPIFEMSAKYGIPYWANFVNSDMKPEETRSMCCRLRLDLSALAKRGGGLFGANALTGSIGVITLNMSRIGYLAKSKQSFLNRTGRLMDLAKEALEVKRKVVERFTERGLYPYSRFYLRGNKERLGGYWAGHFSTIGLNGLNEGLINLMKKNIATKAGREFAGVVLDYMREKLVDYQKETGNLYNLEATPAEGTSYRLAKIDKKKYPQIIVANEKQVKKGAAPFYTNSSQLPVDVDGDLFQALKLQDSLQCKYTGGTVFHTFLGERLENGEEVKVLAKKIVKNFSLPYFSFTPTFSVCPEHGYLKGEHFQCPKCGAESEVYSRVVGYLRPVSQWNKGKKAEFDIRKSFKTK
ncbi:ribonucleoside triphosphate reductase [Candidatus Microgenomates bacterium]|nr:ribonucleoside triphosphate reductase [Candidatus Microgenomates bacterium]